MNTGKKLRTWYKCNDQKIYLIKSKLAISISSTEVVFESMIDISFFLILSLLCLGKTKIVKNPVSKHKLPQTKNGSANPPNSYKKAPNVGPSISAKAKHASVTE